MRSIPERPSNERVVTGREPVGLWLAKVVRVNLCRHCQRCRYWATALLFRAQSHMMGSKW
jgi:hypothetical protein